MQRLILALCVLLPALSGCASIAGNARYTYSRTVHADGSVTVSVDVDSGRNLAKGFTGGVAADGALTINVGSAVQGESAVNALGELVLTGLLTRGLQLPAPTPQPAFPTTAPAAVAPVTTVVAPTPVPVEQPK